MMLKLHTLRELTRDELLQKRVDLLDERFNLNMRRSLKALDNPLRLRQIRREIARIETVLREDELGLRKLAESTTSVLSSSASRSRSKKAKEEKAE
ncbi:MAG: 50S ribosomal protein L29 [candidate division Zixibacteria bacterium]|nr:50S ribosomal protein L29 [candidate division Zixibacteria bacterium]